MFESLELRRLLSTTLVGSTLTVDGSKGNDRITVVENNQSVHVEVTGSDGVMVVNDFNGITAININGLGGGDTINYTGNSVGANIHGDSGKGKVGGSHGGGSGGGSGGGACADFISVTDAGTGSSVVDGDGGNDDITIIAGNMSGGRTTVYGGSGNDNIQINTDNGSSYNTVSAHCLVYTEAGKDTVTTYDGHNTLDGGAGKDTLIESSDSVNVFTGFETVIVMS